MNDSDPSAAGTAERLQVDIREGLSAAETGRRLERDGPNRLAEAAKEPRWRAFLRQFQDLLIAAVVSLVVTREWETPVVIALVVLLNATIGFAQASKAEASLETLKKMRTVVRTPDSPRSIIGKSDLADLLSNREWLSLGLELMIDSPAAIDRRAVGRRAALDATRSTCRSPSVNSVSFPRSRAC